LPELLLFFGAFFALMTNPTPFPYNLLHVVPYAFLLAFRYGASIWDGLRNAPGFWPILTGVLIFSQVIPFVITTRRHLNHPNWRQAALMSLAEKLTDPELDPVYDAAGLVTTRRSVHFLWYLHSWNISRFVEGPGPRIHEILSARPAAVFIPNYRTDWLTPEDHQFIRSNYVSLADDFWVLGKVLSAGGGTFEVLHPGRYRISTLKGSDLVGTYPEGYEGMRTPEDKGTLSGTLDGVRISALPIQLNAGKHQIETAPGCQPAIVWVGPGVDRVHRVTPGDHRALFQNWY
jgi:hypothetical protein